MEKRNQIHTIEDYIKKFPYPLQVSLRKLKQTIMEAAPGAEEIISYQMPAFKTNGRILVYFAVHKNHIGFYAMPSAILAFKSELTGYETSKGTIRFPIENPLPFGLVKKLVKFRVNENLMKKK